MSDNNEEVICSICMCSLVCQDDSSVVTQCGHIYHATCIKTWLKQSSKCPLCNKAASLQQLKTVFLSVPTQKTLSNAADKSTSSTSTNNQQANLVVYRNKELDKEIKYQFKIFQNSINKLNLGNEINNRIRRHSDNLQYYLKNKFYDFLSRQPTMESIQKNFVDAAGLILSKRTEDYIKILEDLKEANENTIRSKDIAIVALNEKLRENSSRLDNYRSQMATIDDKNRKIADLKDEVTRIKSLHALSMNNQSMATKRLDELKRELKTALEREVALKKEIEDSNTHFTHHCSWL